MDGWVGGRVDGLIDGWIHGWMDTLKEGWTDVRNTMRRAISAPFMFQPDGNKDDKTKA